MSQAWIIIFVIGLCHGVSKAADCTERGRFPNDLLEACRGYTTCIGAGPTFYQYDLPCPPNFVYSHLDNQCTNSSTYRCHPEHSCTGTGNFANPNSSDCSTYIACVQGLSKIVTARLVECPANTIFNPIVQACVQTESYSCFQTTTNTISVNTAMASTGPPGLTDGENPQVVMLETPGMNKTNCAHHVNLPHFIFVLTICMSGFSLYLI